MSSAVTPAVSLHPFNSGFQWTPRRPDRRRRLTAAQHEQFDREGYCRLEGVFSPEAIAALTAAIDPLERQHEQKVREEGGRLRLTAVGAITFTAHLVRQSPAINAFSRHRLFRDVCHDLIGDDVRLYWDQSVYKRTQLPQEFPWHQDNGYNFVEPQQYLTFWLPLCDVDEGNGCPWIAPGMHRLGTLKHEPTPIGLRCFDSCADAVCVPARAGDAIVFSSLTPHRTGPNLKLDSVRKAYILQYAPEGVVVRRPDGQRIPQQDPDRQYRILEGGR